MTNNLNFIFRDDLLRMRQKIRKFGRQRNSSLYELL